MTAQSKSPPKEFQPHKAGFYQSAGAHCLVALQKTVNATLRFEYQVDADFLSALETGPLIYSVWHNNLFVSMAIWRKIQTLSPGRKNRLAGLISASRDGAFLSAVLTKYQVIPIRGSSSRRGGQALIELTRTIQSGNDVAVTPDGPRGPRHSIHEGVLSLARITDRPIIPVSVRYSRAITLRSWDLFLLPYPFSRCAVRIHGPVRVPRKASATEQKDILCLLREGMSWDPSDPDQSR